MTLALVLNLASCGEKAVSQEVSIGYKEKPQQISQQFSEVSPPDVIQELRPALEIYRPQVTIVTPKPDEVLQENTVTVSFQVKDLPIFKDPQLELGPHLHVILDNQPYIAVYDLNQPLLLPDLSPGTHTLRVFASRPWHESFKNEGAYAQTTFHIFTKTDDNQPDPTLPLLTYSRPKDSYGAEPILLDFYLTNAPLHLVAKDDSNDEFGNWRIRSTINGESFVLDRWQAVYLKGFKPGKNWVKLEFLDNQGNPVKNAFNTTVRVINYQPKGKDTLSRIVRGELQAEDVRGIVDQNYTAKKPTTEPTPTPSATTTPTVETTAQPQRKEEQPIPETKVLEIPQTQPTELPQPEITPTPEATEVPKNVTPEPEKQRFGGFFNRRSRPTTQPSPSLTPTLPEVIESPAPEVTSTPKPQPEVTPTPQATELLQDVTPEPEKQRFGGFFNRRFRPTAQPSPSLPPTLPEVIESPAPEITPTPEQ
ncbi:hypothetical protein A6770_34900 [Nostoc minutum NIES-26]|uniref:Uncharacterized protein n=1 Tax=Nostoc minutum NIES-26 TaxID=1844469 RepID=A0A367S0S8_9NOSO|nr:hypothetical protein A6770_34900 [Nostoc minutum NIES-26]